MSADGLNAASGLPSGRSSLAASTDLAEREGFAQGVADITNLVVGHRGVQGQGQLSSGDGLGPRQTAPVRAFTERGELVDRRGGGGGLEGAAAAGGHGPAAARPPGA